MPTTDLSQPINRKEALAIQAKLSRLHDELGPLIARAQGNGHDDAPDFADEALTSLSNAIASIDDELDKAKARAA